MKPQVLINPKSIPVNDRAFNYGDGVFETILVRDGNPLFIDQHIKRFYRGCDVLKIIKPTKKIGSFFWKKGDIGTIDRFGPDGISKLIKIISNKAGRLQTGFIYDYAFVMLIGLSILLTYLILN